MGKDRRHKKHQDQQGKRKKNKGGQEKPRKVREPKPKGPVPDYTPNAARRLRKLREERERTARERARVVAAPAVRPVVVVEPDPTDPKLIWDGKVGIVAIDDMRFRVSEEKGKDFQFPVVRVLGAPAGTELQGLTCCQTYVTVAQLRAFILCSSFAGWKKKEREVEKRIWDFLDRVFRKAGLKDAAPAATASARSSAEIIDLRAVAAARPVGGRFSAPQYGMRQQ